jgi:predicted ATPase
MIRSLELRNFKAIKKKHFLLRNLNILLGLNGQGKSSFIQALLLLRQSDKLSKGELKLSGGLVNIGTAKDVFYQYSPRQMSMALQLDDADFYQMNFDYLAETDLLHNTTAKDGCDYLARNAEQPLFTNNFQYLNAQRIEPKSVNIAGYASVMDANSLGSYGQYTAHYIELRGSEAVLFDNLLHKDAEQYEDKGETKIDRTLKSQINLWLGEISPGVRVQTSKISSDLILLEYKFKQPTLGTTNSFKPENVGFGISYALHVVTALLSARPGELIIIENPESHIHPRGQAELGKLIARVAQNENVQVIIETHSDHILNGIRVAVKEAELDNDKVIVFYFSKVVADMEQYAKITDIAMDKNGTLSEYPENLLDEWSNQLSKLI